MRGCHTISRFALALLISMPALAAVDVQPNYRDIRWMGRGNTGVGSVADASSVFYNPAGLAFNRGVNFSVLNPSLGANNNVFNTFNALKDAASNDETLSRKFAPFLGKPLTLEGNVFPSVTISNFSFGFYDSLHTLVEYRNPVDPRMDFNYRNDWGFVLGGAFMPVKNLSFGLSLRYIKRKAIQETLSGSLLLDSIDSLRDEMMKSGEAWGLNLGTQYRMQINSTQYFSFGVAMEDVGVTTFRNRSGDNKAPPDAQGDMINFGAVYGFQSTALDGQFLMDMRGLSQDSIAMSKKFFFGGELSFLKLDLRAGLYQGYITAGVSVRMLPFLDIDLTTYGEELGHAAGIQQNRVWLIGIRTGIDVAAQTKSVKKQRFNLDDIK